MSLPTPVTIYAGDVDLSYLPPRWDSGERDFSWSFYRSGVRWCCLRKKWNDPDNGNTYAPAMFVSEDNGATWTGPIDDAGAPAYHFDAAAFSDPTDYTAINTGDALIWTYDCRFGAGLEPEAVDHITVLIVTGALIYGPDAGEVTFAYCDFDFGTRTWGSTYGAFHRPANVLYKRGYSSQPDIALAAPLSATPVFWYSDGSPAPQIEGALATDGGGGYGYTNSVVRYEGTVYLVADTRVAGTTDPKTLPDAGDLYTSNLRIIDFEVTAVPALLIAAAPAGVLSLYTKSLSGGGGWVADTIPDSSPTVFGENPFVLVNLDSVIEVYWLGSDFGSIYRAKKVGAGWTTPEIVGFVDGVALGPNVCNNPVLGGTDVTVMVDPFTVVTFHVDAAGGGVTAAARYYGM